MRDTRCWAESTMQSMPRVLGRWHRLLHVRALLARWYSRKQEVHQVRSRSLLYPELLHKEGPTARSQVREERRLQRIPHGKSTSKEVSKERIQEHSRSIYPWHMVQKNHAGIKSYRRSDSRDGQTGERKPHPHCHRRRTRRVSWQLVDTFEFCGFQYDAYKASPWLQTSVVNLASPHESRGWSLLPKLVAKLFLIMVAKARFLVASLTTWHWSNGETCENQWNCLFTCGMSLTMNVVQNYSDHFGTSQRSSLSPTGGVKSTSPTTENGYENCTYTAQISTRAMRTSTTQTTSTTSTRTPTRASCTTCEHGT